jgi:hypothetical protein
MPWLGTRRVAFVPVDRGLYNENPVPLDWKGDIERRVFYDSDSVTGVDVSLRNFILTMSQGRADITGEVLDTITFVHPGDVAPSDLTAQLDPIQQSGAYDAGAVIMLGGRGAGRNYGFWSRFVMLEGVGVWAMELMHGLTGMADLYTNLVPHDLGNFDTMACACGTHLTAYTRMLLGWLDPSAIVTDTSAEAGFVLHATSLGPAPSGRVHAVQTQGSGQQVIAEARLRGDQFDGKNQYNPGERPADQPPDANGAPARSIRHVSVGDHREGRRRGSGWLRRHDPQPDGSGRGAGLARVHGDDGDEPAPRSRPGAQYHGFVRRQRARGQPKPRGWRHRASRNDRNRDY